MIISSQIWLLRKNNKTAINTSLININLFGNSDFIISLNFHVFINKHSARSVKTVEKHYRKPNTIYTDVNKNVSCKKLTVEVILQKHNLNTSCLYSRV